MRSLLNSFLLYGLFATGLQGSEADIRWAGERDGVNVGVRHDRSFSGNGLLVLYAMGTTNYRKNLVIPEIGQKFSLVLLNTNENWIKTTGEGERLGVDLSPTMARARRISRQLRFPDDEPLQIGYVRLDELLVVRTMGECQLEIRPHLLQENGKELKPLAFNPIQIKLPLMQNVPATNWVIWRVGEAWGSYTNDIKAGLVISCNQETNGQILIECVPQIASPLTNRALIWFPPNSSMHLLALVDEQGQGIQATEKLKELGQPLTEKLLVRAGVNYRAGYSGRQLRHGSEWPQPIGEKKFLLNDYFEVTNGGVYRLTYTMKVVLPSQGLSGSLVTNVPSLVSLPPVDVEIKVTKDL